DEKLVGGSPLRLYRFTPAAGGETLRNEAALCADRHDHRILHVLRLDQPQDLRAEILRPVGPANAAARDLAEAQMDALDARRIGENFEERPRQRHLVNLAAGEFD